jgi:hypothetical protein
MTTSGCQMPMPLTLAIRISLLNKALVDRLPPTTESRGSDRIMMEMMMQMMKTSFDHFTKKHQ